MAWSALGGFARWSLLCIAGMVTLASVRSVDGYTKHVTATVFVFLAYCGK